MPVKTTKSKKSNVVKINDQNKSLVNQFDLGLICDATGSMGNFMALARAELTALVESASAKSDIDTHIGLVEYRDHSDKWVTQVHQLTPDMNKIKQSINAMKADGGGDAPEAAFDGIYDAVNKFNWRTNARKIMVLVGDEPPHGTSGSPMNKDACPCGKTLSQITTLVEENGITLHSICLTNKVLESFGELSFVTGGMLFDASRHGTDAMKELGKILTSEFSNMVFDSKVMNLWNDGVSSIDIATQLDVSQWAINNSIGRLGSRKLLRVEEGVLV